MMKKLKQVIITSLLLIVSVNGRTLAQEQIIQSRKKVIYYGWGAPDTRYIRDHWHEMEEMPFDGIGIKVAIDRTKPTSGNSTTSNLLGWNVFGSRAFRLEEFNAAIADLKAAKWQRLTDNFLAVAIAPSGLDQNFNWFDDARWETIVNNWRVLVTIAKAGGCKGIILDPEHYGFPLFRYADQRQRVDKPFAEYTTKVRQRGRELMTTTRQILPDITILCLYGYAVVWNSVRNSANTRRVRSLEEVNYGLFPAFLDGLLEAASPQARIVDGYESAYGFKKRSQFERAYEDIKRKAINLSEVPERYANQVEVGFGLWLDKGGIKQWSTTDFTKNYFQPDEFEQVLQAALQVSDRYVWVYSQAPRPFPPSNLPGAYLEAIASARRK